MDDNLKAKKRFVLILRFACALLFLGRGWQHFFWDAPFRTLLWDEALLKTLVESWSSLSWHEYVVSPVVDKGIELLTVAFGIFYFFMAGVSLFVSSKARAFGRSLWLGSLGLFFLSFLYFMEKGFLFGMLIEHAIQFGAPLILYGALFKENFLARHVLLIKAAISFTFIGHGLFALGYYPVPGPFIDMMINIFGVGENEARHLLMAAGVLDLSAGVLIFFKPFELVALGFACFWGTSTALARVAAHVDLELLAFSSHQWIMETVYRIPHGLVPLALLLYFISIRVPKSNKVQVQRNEALA